MILNDGGNTTLLAPEQFVGYINESGPSAILFRHNGLHIEIQIDRDHPVGSANPSSVKDWR